MNNSKTKSLLTLSLVATIAAIFMIPAGLVSATHEDPAAVDLGTECDPDNIICKDASMIFDDDGDGIIETGEKITYFIHIEADNQSGEVWTSVTMKDRFGGDVDVTSDPVTPSQGVCTLTQKGKTQKEFLDCVIGTVTSGTTISMDITAETDINYGQSKKAVPKNEYTSCGVHDVNSGATIKFTDSIGDQYASTGSIQIEVFTDDKLGDCDGDGIIDADDAEPFVFNDADGDGVGDGSDICPGGDDTVDTDVDGTPDFCDADPLDPNVQ